MRSAGDLFGDPLVARLELALLLGRRLLRRSIVLGLLALLELDSAQTEAQVFDRAIDLAHLPALHRGAASEPAPGLRLKRAEPRLDLG